jgi:hypothetical protein
MASRNWFEMRKELEMAGEKNLLFLVLDFNLWVLNNDSTRFTGV